MRMQRNKDHHKLNTWILGAMMVCMAVVMVCMSSTMASAKAISSPEQAKKLALQKVKFATIIKVEEDMDDGVAVYEVSLHKGSKEYDLKYRKSDGKLLEFEWELPDLGYSDQTKANVSKTKIKKKALKQVRKASVRSIRLKSDDGRMEYKILLQKGSYRYTLVYDAKKAKLLKYEQKYTGSGEGAPTSKEISMNKARQIALKKVPGATVVKIERDRENGTVVYEVELKKGYYEYEIIIDAKSGKIKHTEKEYDD